MPVILATPEECDVWMIATADEALRLQRPLADSLLSIVACGEKQDPPRQRRDVPWPAALNIGEHRELVWRELGRAVIHVAPVHGRRCLAPAAVTASFAPGGWYDAHAGELTAAYEAVDPDRLHA